MKKAVWIAVFIIVAASGACIIYVPINDEYSGEISWEEYEYDVQSGEQENSAQVENDPERNLPEEGQRIEVHSLRKEAGTNPNRDQITKRELKNQDENKAAVSQVKKPDDSEKSKPGERPKKEPEKKSKEPIKK